MEARQRGSPSESLIWTPMVVMFFSWYITNPAIMAAIMGLGLGVSGWGVGLPPALAELLTPPV